MHVPVTAGVFVGGQSRRFGGVPKGLLRAPSGTTLIARWQELFTALNVPMVLVGQNGAYAPLGLTMLADRVGNSGPLGGLLALLEHAPHGYIVAVACDMPYLSSATVQRLIAFSPRASAVAARRRRWEPFCARYHSPSILPLARDHAARGVMSLNALLDAAGGATLDDVDEHELVDWDSPADVRR